MFSTIQIGKIFIIPYTVLTFLGFFVAIAVALTFIKKGFRRKNAFVALMGMMCSIIIGNLLRLFIVATGKGSFTEFFITIDGHLPYSDVFGIAFAGIIAHKHSYINMQDSADAFAVFLPLFHFFKKTGCFLSGCCYSEALANHSDTFHFPTQPVEAAGCFAIFITLLILLKKGKLKSRLLYLYLILYPALNFVCEGFRFGNYMESMVNQIISIGLMLLGIHCLYSQRRKIMMS